MPPVTPLRERRSGSASPPAFVVYGLFFVSGMASLMCEVVWFKQLQLVVGGTAYAASVVVASFFAGLSLGSWAAGTYADRWRRRLRAYGLLEITLALVSAAVTMLLSRWPDWAGTFAPWMGTDAGLARPVMAMLGLAILLPPTVLMGATLPVLARHVAPSRRFVARRVGSLYAINTLGAAIGSLVVGFALVGLLGVRDSALVASALYGVVGLTALIVARTWPDPSQGDAGRDSGEDEPDAIGASYPVVSPNLIAAAFALSGFAAIAYEVLWFRLLSYFTISTVYAFSAMLSVYLLGLVLGAALCARYLAPHKHRLLVYFARAQLLAAAAAALSAALLGRSRNILATVRDALEKSGLAQTDAGLFSQTDFLVIVLALIALLVPATILGLSFPLASELAAVHRRSLGRRIGRIYALNTLGGVLGALAAGFLLLPMLGSQGSFAAVILVNMAVFAMLYVRQANLRAEPGLGREAMATVTLLVATWMILGGDYIRRTQTAFTGAQVLEFRENAEGTFAVLGYDGGPAGRFQQLVVNGRSYASNAPPGRRYMAALGHLPVLLHPDPRRVAVVAVGTGTTAGAVSLHPEVRELWAVDISAAVFEMAGHFSPINQNFLDSDKTRVVVADGRHFLLSTDRRFDVLTFEPPPPIESGVVNLYSREFYRLARSRLAAGGILCQWVPLNLDRESLSRMLIRSLLDEFPYVSLWLPARAEGIVIASDRPLEIDVAAVRRRMMHPLVREDMSAYGLGAVEQLLATFVAAGDGLDAFTGPVRAVTDDRPYVEYFNQVPRQEFRFPDLLRHRQDVNSYVITFDHDPVRLERELAIVNYLRSAWESENQVAAGEALKAAQMLDPDNRYLSFRLAEFRARQAVEGGG